MRGRVGGRGGFFFNFDFWLAHPTLFVLFGAHAVAVIVHDSGLVVLHPLLRPVLLWLQGHLLLTQAQSAVGCVYPFKLRKKSFVNSFSSKHRYIHCFANFAMGYKPPCGKGSCAGFRLF